MLKEMAHKLVEAERARIPIPPLTSNNPSLSESDAYKIQDLVIGLKGGRVRGFKIGFASRSMREQMGIFEPNYGQLTQEMEVEEREPLSLRKLIHPRVEAELAVLVERDLCGPGVTKTNVIFAVRWVFAALEVVDSRFIDYHFRSPDNIADNSSAARYVLGAGLPLEKIGDGRLLGVLLWKDGRVVDEGIGADVLGGPLNAVAWLANKLSDQGKIIPSGSLILTGGITRAHPVGKGGTFVAEFGLLGTVKLHFYSGDQQEV